MERQKKLETPKQAFDWLVKSGMNPAKAREAFRDTKSYKKRGPYKKSKKKAEKPKMDACPDCGMGKRVVSKRCATCAALARQKKIKESDKSIIEAVFAAFSGKSAKHGLSMVQRRAVRSVLVNSERKSLAIISRDMPCTKPALIDALHDALERVKEKK